MPPRIALDACTLDLDRRTVTRRTGEVVRLSPIETALLRYLVDRAGQVVPSPQLLTDVWGYAPGVTSRTVKTTVGRLRRKIELDPTLPVSLVTVPGVGYALDRSPDR
jgi:two-component system KDP operon response regulator KdpE